MQAALLKDSQSNGVRCSRTTQPFLAWKHSACWECNKCLEREHWEHCIITSSPCFQKRPPLWEWAVLWHWTAVQLSSKELGLSKVIHNAAPLLTEEKTLKMLWRKVLGYKLCLEVFCSSHSSNARLKKSVVSLWLWWYLDLVFDGKKNTAIGFLRPPVNTAIATLQDK